MMFSPIQVCGDFERYLVVYLLFVQFDFQSWKIMCKNGWKSSLSLLSEALNFWLHMSSKFCSEEFVNFFLKAVIVGVFQCVLSTIKKRITPNMLGP